MALVIGAVLFFLAIVIHGWVSDKSKRLKEDEFNRNLRARLEDRERMFEMQVESRTKACDRREAYVNELRSQFNTGVLNGRRWLAKYVAEADRAFDETIVEMLRTKKHPALKAADEVAEAKAERRQFKERAKFLEYQLLSLKEYFPFLDEYEELLLDEAVPLASGQSNTAALEGSDPVLRFVSKNDYNKLTTADRNQLALDRYLSKSLSSANIGRLYECYLGYLYEREGWQVEYHGIVKGFEDLGRDLICTRGNIVRIVQAKCWSTQKTIHEKHIFQLFGTTQLYLMDQMNTNLNKLEVSAHFVTSTSLSGVARKAAEWLKIEVEENKSLSKSFPMIKCNISQRDGEKIYHLPFDQQYGRTKIDFESGEFYAASVAEAEKGGFRRAFRYVDAFN